MNITRAEMRTMPVEDLLAIAYTDKYDKWFYLKTLLGKAPEEYFRKMRQELERGVLDGVPWLAVWCRDAYDSAVFGELETALIKRLGDGSKLIEGCTVGKDEKARRLSEFYYSNGHMPMQMSYLYGYSDWIQEWWKKYYQTRLYRTGQVTAVYGFAPSRQMRMGVPQLDSFHALMDCGWDVRQIFLSFIIQHKELSYPLDPEAVRQLVAEFPDEAADLTNLENYDKYIEAERFDDPATNLNWFSVRLAGWLDFLYSYCGWTDREPLLQGLKHKRKVVRQACEELLEEMEHPSSAWERYEQELQQFGLLHSENIEYKSTPKKEKQRSKVLLSACVCRYFWSPKSFSEAFLVGQGKDIAGSLLWARYDRNGTRSCFTVGGEGPVDLSGNPLALSQDSKICIEQARNLQKEEIKEAQRYFRGNKIRQPFQQMKVPTPLQPGDLAGKNIIRYQELVRSQLAVITTAGKWGLEKTEGYANSWTCYHMTDPLHGLGAQLCVERIWGGPEYNEEERAFGDACIYKLPEKSFRYGELVPEEAKLDPAAVPLPFLSSVLAAFDAVTGWK